MYKKRSAFGYKRELGQERGSFLVSPMVGWLELIAITISCLSCKAFCTIQSLKVLKIGISCAFMLVLFLCKRWAWQEFYDDSKRFDVYICGRACLNNAIWHWPCCRCHQIVDGKERLLLKDWDTSPLYSTWACRNCCHYAPTLSHTRRHCRAFSPTS